MARVVVHAIWQQKHPTPTNATWEFHWHPPEGARALGPAIAALDLALAGGSGLAIAPRALAWVRAFTAEAPSEQRSYVGLAGIVAEGDAAFGEVVPAVLEAIALPPAGPCAAEVPARALELAPAAPAPVEVDASEAEALARLVVAGGRVAVAAPGDAGWSRRVGRLLSWLPPEARVRERSANLVEEARAAPPLASPWANVCHYLSRGWRHPAGLATWKLVHGVRRPVGELFAFLEELAGAWKSADALARHLRAALGDDLIARCDAAAPAPLLAGDGDAGMLWNRVVHHWGRGFLPGADERLGRILAGRVLLDHLVRLDDGGDADLPLRYVRRLRYEALVPAPRAEILLGVVRRELGVVA